MYGTSCLILSCSFYECYIFMPLSILTLIILKHSSNYSIFISSKNNYSFDTPDVYFLDSSLVLHFFMHFRIMDHRHLRGTDFCFTLFSLSFSLYAFSSQKSYEATSTNVLGPLVEKQFS